MFSENGYRRLFLRGIRQDKDLYVTASATEKLVLPSKNATAQVRVGAPGFRTQEVKLFPGFNRIVLQPGLSVRCKVPGMQDLPAEVRLYVELTTAQSRSLRFRSKRREVPPSGELEILLPGPGAYEFSLWGEPEGGFPIGYSSGGEVEDVLHIPQQPGAQIFLLDHLLEFIIADIKTQRSSH